MQLTADVQYSEKKQQQHVLLNFPQESPGEEVAFERASVAPYTETFTLREIFRQYYNPNNIIALFSYHRVSIFFQLYFSNHLVMLQKEISQEIL